MSDLETVFVYGSLRKGMPQHHLVADSPFLGYGSTAPAFTLYDSGDWPAAVAGGVTSIFGEIYALSSQRVGAIDAYERHPDFFCRKQVVLAGRQITSIWIYISDVPDHWKRIAIGDWIRHTSDT